MEPTLGRGDVVAVDARYDEKHINEKIAVGLLVPVSGSNATDGHKEKNACTPDVHCVPLCPSA